MQAYIDESESKDHFVFAGFIGATEQWAAFSDRLDAVLKRPPALRRFKFHDRIEPRRQSALVTAMSGGGFMRIAVGIDIPAFKMRYGHAWEGFDLAFPYCFAFQLMLVAVAHELLSRGQREPFEIIFDQQDVFGPRATRWYPLIRELCTTEEVRSILPTHPIFKSDDDALPLQAADLYAGLVRSGRGERQLPSSSGLLVALSEVKVTSAVAMRAQAQVARQYWDKATRVLSPETVTARFAPIAAKLRKDLVSIGGDPLAERTLAPLFVSVPERDPDGFNWLRQELAEVATLSASSLMVDRHGFGIYSEEDVREAMARYGITEDQLSGGRLPHSDLVLGPRAVALPDEALTRAIALLDEKSIGAFRKKLAKKRGAKKRSRARGVT